MQPEHAAIRSVPSPAAIAGALDAQVVGHDRVKRKLAAAAHVHLQRHALTRAGVDKRRLIPKLNVLLAGPTGSGKTLLARTLAHVLDCPFFATSAASYCAAGYRGLRVESMVEGLITAAGGSAEYAKTGIVFIDEVDKIRRRNFGGQDDVGGVAVQQDLLTLLDGGSVLVGPQNDNAVETDGIMFIAAGVFPGMLEEASDPCDAHIPSEALESFGMIPEFIGRFAVRQRLEPLTSTELLTVLTRSVMEQLVDFCAVYGVRLEIDESALDAMVSLAAAEGTGARALTEVVFRRIPVTELLSDLAGVSRVIIDRETIVDGKPPLKVPGDPDPKSSLRPIRSDGNAVESKSSGFTDCRGWTPEKIRQRLEQVKKAIGWTDLSDMGDHNWRRFEKENRHRSPYVLRIAEEIARRDTTLTEFFSHTLGSKVEDMDGKLAYFDYIRVLCREEKEKQAKWQAACRRARARYKPKE